MVNSCCFLLRITASFTEAHGPSKHDSDRERTREREKKNEKQNKSGDDHKEMVKIQIGRERDRGTNVQARATGWRAN